MSDALEIYDTLMLQAGHTAQLNPDDDVCDPDVIHAHLHTLLTKPHMCASFGGFESDVLWDLVFDSITMCSASRLFVRFQIRGPRLQSKALVRFKRHFQIFHLDPHSAEETHAVDVCGIVCRLPALGKAFSASDVCVTECGHGVSLVEFYINVMQEVE
jgi:hypothetical protein